MRRVLARKAGSVQQVEGKLRGPEGEEDYPASEMKERILGILNFREPTDPKSRSLIYQYAIYTAQEEMKQIISLRPELRLQILRRAFGVEEYKLAMENARDLLVKMRGKRGQFETASREIPSLRKEVEELERKVSRGEVDIVKLERAEEEEEKAALKLEAEREELHEVELRLASARPEQANLKREMREAEGEAEDLTEEVGRLRAEGEPNRGKEARRPSHRQDAKGAEGCGQGPWGRRHEARGPGGGDRDQDRPVRVGRREQEVPDLRPRS